MNEIKTKLKHILSKITGYEVDLRKNLKLTEDLHIDSIDIMCLVRTIEEEFHITIESQHCYDSTFKDTDGLEKLIIKIKSEN